MKCAISMNGVRWRLGSAGDDGVVTPRTMYVSAHDFEGVLPIGRQACLPIGKCNNECFPNGYRFEKHAL